ncbi:MAG: FAD-dependent oxidoreductase [Alphaproteobacteria bacterium]
MTEDQVLIVGAGPAGLTTAALLAEAGVPALVLEAEAELPTNLRASTFHPPTLDMLDRFGVTDKLIAQGLIAPTVQYRDRKAGKIAEFDFGELADVTSRPYRLQCEQYKLNFALLDYIESQKSVSVRFDASVTGVEQTDDWVEASLSDGSSVRGRWLMGADGARSVVREALAIPFEGFTWPEAFLVVSTAFPFEQHMDDLCWVNYFADPEEWFFLLRAPDFWRVMFPTGPDETEAEIFDETRIQARLHRVLPKATPYEIAHTTLYRVHQRVATRYREGRAFLAGDAAHINNPLGGMGMNGGIHDAFNLGEKLVAVMAKGADPAILNQYETERRPVALEYVNEITIRNKRNLETADPAEQSAFRAMLAATAADPAKRRAFLLRASMLASLGVSG